ncbi:MAG: TPM domain-containing protein [Bradyrhizobium sp.]|nr:YgcG family protein [Bradyrhizobium sp.]
MKAARAVLLALLLGWVFPAFALVAVPQLTGRVIDQTGTLSSGDVAQLSQKLADLQTRKGSQIAVLIVPTTEGEPIEQFSLRVAEAWKIGRKKVDDGALLVVAKNDRRLRIEIGYGLEGVLTDVTSKRIIDEIITPKFKSGDFAGGLSAGIDKMIGLINGEKLPEPEPAHWNGDGFNFDVFNPFWLFFAFVISGIFRSMLGRLMGSIATGGAVAALVWFLFGGLAAAIGIGVLASIVAFIVDFMPTGGGSRSGGWSGGSSGGWSSGSSSSGSSSSDSGGFSGGGGSFGGGGASGSW